MLKKLIFVLVAIVVFFSQFQPAYAQNRVKVDYFTCSDAGIVVNQQYNNVTFHFVVDNEPMKVTTKLDEIDGNEVRYNADWNPVYKELKFRGVSLDSQKVKINQALTCDTGI